MSKHDYRIKNTKKEKIRESKYSETCGTLIRGGRGLHKWFVSQPPSKCVSLTPEQIAELNKEK